MKITGYHVEHYLMKMDRLVGDANLPSGVEMLPGSILYLETDENVTGISLGYGGGIEGLFGAIEGADPRETVALWIRMNDWLHKAGNEGAASASLSAIDVALWDIKAKLADEPLWRTLGAREGRVRAYASGLDYCLSDEELFAFYRRMAEQGIDTGKLKVGLDLKADLRRLGIMREALGIASPRPRTDDRRQRVLVAEAGRALRAAARGALRSRSGWRSPPGAGTTTACASCRSRCGRPWRAARTCTTSPTSIR